MIIQLMSTDIERICVSLKNLHEIWANVIELGIAMYLLQHQLGLACLVPVAVIAGEWPSKLKATSSNTAYSLNVSNSASESICGCCASTMGP